MRKLVRITLNGRTFSAYPGDVVLDAALLSGIGMPHDCQGGTCGACRVRVISGRVQGGETGEPGTMLACRGRALTDLELSTDEVPEAVKRTGRLERVVSLADDVLEVTVAPTSPLPILPGQFVELTFQGCPPRAYMPTRPLDARADDDGRLRFHVQHRKNSRVSAALGGAIGIGSKVGISGPHGTAYWRRSMQGRLVLVSSGTGFALTWAIADAALRERPDRAMLLIVGVETVASLYMVQALDQMAACPNVRILVTSAQKQSLTTVILPGRPADYLPPLLSRDVVHAAGPVAMIDAIAEVARAAKAACHAEAFTAAEDVAPRGWLSRVFRTDRGRSVSEPGANAAPATLTARLGALSATPQDRTPDTRRRAAP